MTAMFDISNEATLDRANKRNKDATSNSKRCYSLKISVWLGLFMLQNLETALAGGLGQMSLVNDYRTFRPNLRSSSVVVRYRAW